MASPEQEAAVTAAVVENVMQMHWGEGESAGGVGGGETVGSWRNIDIAWRKAKEAAIRRYEAANWLRRIVGVVCAKDLSEEPSEEEFRLGLRNGIILCNALNKVVEVPSDSTVPADGAALCAYQYFENVRNFVIGLQDLGLPTFEASDLEKGGQGVRVVNCVLALKSFSDARQVGKQSPFKYGGIVKPLCGKYAIRKNNEPFMKVMTRSHSAELLRDGISLEQIGLDFSLEPTDTTTPDSIRMLVQTVLSDKKPEEIPFAVETLLSKVINEFERRIASQNELVKDTTDINDSNSLLRTDSPFDTNGSMSLSRTDSLQMESTSTSDPEKATAEDRNSLRAKEDVSTVVPALLSNNNVDKCTPKPVRNFDQEQKQIQDLKSNISSIKSGMEQLKSLYSEDLMKLGDHLRIVSHAASAYHKVLEENRKLYNQIQDLRGGQAKTLMFVHIAPEPDAVSESISTLKFAERVATVELGAAKSNKEGGEVRELKEQIACLKAALARKDGEHESIRSTQSSPDIYRMRMGNASKHPTDDGNVEKPSKFELFNILVEDDPSAWIDICYGVQKDSALGDWPDHSQFGSSNSLPELGPDGGSQDLTFYQRSSPEKQWSWSGSVATEDSDDFEVATSCSSEQDCMRPSSAPKASGFANGGSSAARKAQPKGPKSSDIRGVNPAKRTSPLQKKLNGASPTLIKKSGVEGKRAPNGKVSTKK
ncbi:Kinesin-4 [Dichanthelium oligosanthes]|uniref:Kinesin-4 n=1 Tax=Dichanthelium oligosanthes TaxID=888268 RepID=A0A1E5VY48_9POAL|nr:Kinesin-4 [Dichanthelium oligosanthes]